MVPRGSVLKIDFLAFDTEECFDSLHIYVGRRLVRRLSGDDADDDDDDEFDKCDKDDKDDGDDGEGIFGWYFNRDEDMDDKSVTIQGTGEMIRLVFVSDYSITKRGFFARYIVLKALCGGPLVLPSGTFRSPGYPGKYPDDVKCIWTIRVPPGSTLELDFRFFQTEKCDDYLKILQGGRKVRTLSGVYRYSLFGWGNDDDDDCDGDDLDGDGDKDGEDGEWGEDDEYDSEERPRKRFYPSIHRFPSPAGNRFGFPKRAPIGAPYVTGVLIPGTGELVSIIFKADDDDVTEKGFEAIYRVRPGAAFHG
ncbi:tolloid-like protein 2 [Stylophora pistillata]|uniref:tolloid-like protein 2 n=1 Tax=Stylophora pistillata TaxID=50429 RepID=UPI000C03DCA3|nr:tolloid-like protein 2 [Stylophora pistillata]XP_022799135.1 tolloid-like protein 2 [Stylophora pistillata]